MTTPQERTRALTMAGELLRDLRYGRLTLEEAQQQAMVVTRHYPESHIIKLIALRDQAGDNSRSWLAPLDQDETTD